MTVSKHARYWTRPSGQMLSLLFAYAVALMSLLGSTAGATTIPPLTAPWPDPDSVTEIRGRDVTFPTTSPFTIADMPGEPGTGTGTLFMPEGATAEAPVPAVIMLHGAGGVLYPRELTYGRQFARLGIAALVVDAFGARRDRAVGFIDRLIEITETMLVADAYAALRHLAARKDIDARRIVLIGFSYGGMASVFAAYSQVADLIAPKGPRFAGHVAFYGPCIARFRDNRTTGAPVLMMAGSEDAIIDRLRCEEIRQDLIAGGSDVQMIVFEGAYHQWDGSFEGPFKIGRNLADCRFRVGRDGTVYDLLTHLPMMGPLTRKVMLALCTDEEGYLIGRDDKIRAKSNRELGRFLMRLFVPPNRTRNE